MTCSGQHNRYQTERIQTQPSSYSYTALARWLCIVLGTWQWHATTLQVVQLLLKFFFGGGGDIPGPHPPVWNPAQCSTIKGFIFTKHMKLGHSVYVYIYTSDGWIALKYSDTISVSWRAISRGWSYRWDNEPISFSLVKQHGLAVLKHSIQYEALGGSIHMHSESRVGAAYMCI